MKVEIFKMNSDNRIESIGPTFEVKIVQIKDNFYVFNEHLDISKLAEYGSCTVGLGLTTFKPYSTTGVQISNN